ncbi:MAG: amidohydrolase family protein [Armatimonadota bacterium]
MHSLPPLFDANKQFGFSAAARPDYPTARQLLEHLDRLGIGRALAWHAAARDFDPHWGNERLLKEIAEAPGAAERLAPAFVIAPTMLYDQGAVEWLEDAMHTHRVRALRFPLIRNNWAIGEIEPIIERLEPLQPVLFLNFRDPLPKRDVLDFAERYPWLPIIYTQAMWVDEVNAFDLMRRRENIYLETSWLHTYGNIELAVERFGAERLVFGTGYKTHHGAAIAALAEAGITETQREAIAHGNLERLLGLNTTTTRRTPENPSRFWINMLDGRPLGVELIDAHGHIGELGMWVKSTANPTEQARRALQWMDRLGISTMFISGEQPLFTDPVEGGYALEDLLRPYGDRFKGYLAFNPFYEQELVERLDEYFAMPFYAGFKTLCDYWQVPTTDARFTRLWEYADAHRLPILLHTWGGSYDAPGMLKEIAPAYPNAIFILGHSGGSDRAGAEMLAMANPNVFLEWCGSFTVPNPWEETLARVGADRILFGTDAIYHNPYWELGRLLTTEFSDEQLVPILGANMRAIMQRRR